MHIIPQFVLDLLTPYLPALLDWFSKRIYADLIGKADDHLLVQIHKRLDLRPMEQACAGYHHARGPGAPPKHNVPRLVRALLVQQLYGWSQRETERRINYDLVIKWYVGYGLHETGPEHSTLSRFEQWVDQCQHRTLFDEVLRQIDAAFPTQREQEQIGDTFAVRADAAKETLVGLLRHTHRRLLRALHKADAGRADAVQARLDSAALFGPEQEMPEYRLNKEERAARLQTTVLAALEYAAQVREALDAAPPLSGPARTEVEDWLARLLKVVEDNVEIEQADAAPVVRERPNGKKGRYRMGSATDPDASYRKHRDDTTLGYNAQVAATDHFVREIAAHTGAEPDETSIPALLEEQIVHHDLFPPKLIYDAAAGKGKSFARVRVVSGGETQLVASLVDYDKRSTRFGPRDFALSQDGKTLTCPNGQTSSAAYRSGSGEGRNFRFHHLLCRDCPLWSRCRKHAPGKAVYRKVFISDYRPDYDAARAYNQTPAFKADRRRRSRIERFVAELVRHNDARRARRRGLSAVDFQLKGAALALNLKRWVRLRSARASTAQTAGEGRAE